MKLLPTIFVPGLCVAGVMAVRTNIHIIPLSFLPVPNDNKHPKTQANTYIHHLLGPCPSIQSLLDHKKCCPGPLVGAADGSGGDYCCVANEQAGKPHDSQLRC